VPAPELRLPTQRRATGTAPPQPGGAPDRPAPRPALVPDELADPRGGQLDPERSLAEQFNLLRVVDNQRYPAFIHWRGRRFVLQVQPELLRSP
jgi:hypothetical protein